MAHCTRLEKPIRIITTAVVTAMSQYHQELESIRGALQHAGTRLHRMLYEGLKIHIKPDGSPVTNADIEVNHIIQQTLQETFPSDAWLSEESPDSFHRLQASRVWILDPIDGTKPFVKGLPQYTISLALIDQGQPALGIIFNPATQEYFCAVHDQSATLNNQPLRLRQKAHSSRKIVLVNSWNIPQPTLKSWRAEYRCPPMMGSIAYSLALVAAGQVDAVINLGPQNEWDIAAGLILVQTARGLVFDKNLMQIHFNQTRPSVNGIIATHPDALATIQQWVMNMNDPNE